MNKKQLGNSDVQISELIFGCWQMGGDYWGETDDQMSIDAVNMGFEAGMTTFDTAKIYGKGRSEIILGKALAGKRDKVEIITKLWKDSLHKQDAITACEESIKRLNCEYLDSYFIHYPNDEVPIGETMEALTIMKERGLIRSIGLSNFSYNQMVEAAKYAEIDVIQPCYSLVWRFIDRDIFEYCVDNAISMIPYSPLAQGILTGTMKANMDIGDSRKNSPLFQPEYFSRCLEVTEFVKKIAEKYNRTPAQIALNWIINKKGITAPIVGVKQGFEIEASKPALEFKLTTEDLQALEKVSQEFAYSLPKFFSFFDKTIVE